MSRSAGMPKGGSFLVEPVLSDDFFTREDLTEDQRPYEQTAEDFMRKEVMPKADDLDAKKEGLMPSLLKKAGELGLLMSDVPEAYGGLGLPKTTACLIIEKVALNASFNVSFGAHTGIGTLPITFFGNDAQKKKYLPALASGEKLSCYALTEPTAGSDAMSIKTKAYLSPDKKHYILNGTKQFITNASFADVIITYAKVDGDKFTAFILDRGWPGITIGPEEHKMGIKGSSTCQVILEDVKVPVDNLLGEIGKGHYIAFNILNMGRFKLGVGASGGAKDALTEAVRYALERKQFNTPIAQFPAIKEKIADVAAAIYALDAVTFRVAGNMDRCSEGLDATDPEYSKKKIRVVEEFAIEDSIIKVLGSETLSKAADQCLQMFGGYGYVSEYPLERIYRDARINRLFEGTNEINRMLIPGMIMKRAMKGTLPFMDALGRLKEELADGGKLPRDGSGPLGREIRAVEMAKRACLYGAGQAAQRFGQDMDKEQQALMAIADMAILVCAMDSLIGRVTKCVARAGEDASRIQIDMARVYVAESVDAIGALARRLLAGLYQGGELDSHLKNLSVLGLYLGTDTFAAKRRIADAVIAGRGWTPSIGYAREREKGRNRHVHQRF